MKLNIADFTCEERDFLSNPFNAGNKTIATDGKFLVTVPFLAKYKNASEIKNLPRDMIIDLLFRISKIDKFKTFPVVDLNCTEKECKKCQGFGEKECHECGTFTECPICEGSGFENIVHTTSIETLKFKTKDLQRIYGLIDLKYCLDGEFLIFKSMDVEGIFMAHREY